MRVRCRRRISIGVLAGVTGLALSGCGAAGGRSASPHDANRPTLASATVTSSCSGPTVTATASGSINVAPDLLSIVLDVHTQASSAAVALSANNQRARTLVAILKKAGVASSGIQTSGLSIEPTYAHPKGKPAAIDGYRVDDTVTAQVHQLSSAGTVIDRAVSQVGNAVSLDGISFSLENPTAAEATANTQAVHAGMAQAKAMASAAGTSLGTLCSVSEVNSGQYSESGSASAASTSGSGVPIESGSQQVTAQVKIVYALAG
jgi:uncharacterized protein YggE